MKSFSTILMRIFKRLKEQVKEEVKESLQALVDAYECDKIILDTYEDTVILKRHRDDADKDEEPSARSDRGSKRRREGKETESTSDPKEKASKTTGKSTKGSKSHHKTSSESTPAEEPRQTPKDLEEPSHQELEIGDADDQPIAEASQHPEWFQTQKKPPTADYTLTPKLLADPTYELMKRSCKSLVELKFFLKEVYKATTDQLDWNNPKGHQYPHNLLKPLPLIPNSREERLRRSLMSTSTSYINHGDHLLQLSTSASVGKVQDFVYQAEHKDTKKSNEMYYPRFTKVIINFFMTKDPSIPRRNKVNWHYVRDDQMFTTTNLISRHQNTQQFGAMLPVELTNEDIGNSAAYKEYYAIASGAAPPKTKASVRKTQSSFDTTMPPPTATGTRLLTSAKGKQPAKSSKAKDEGTGIIPRVPDVPTDESDEEISWKSSNKDDDDDVDDHEDEQDDDDQDDNDDD
nr:hypothetical protein [Tanacetum cinerariifolium]